MTNRKREPEKHSNKPSSALAVLSMAFLWPCLIPTTYYSIIPLCEKATNPLSFPLFSLVPLTMIAAIALSIPLSKRRARKISRENDSSIKALALFGTFGFIGHTVLSASMLSLTIPLFAIAVSCVLIALYVVAYGIAAGRMLSQGSSTTVAFKALLSFALWETVSLFLDVLSIDLGMLLPFFTLGSASCALLACKASKADAYTYIRSASLKVPWPMILGSAAFVLFDVLYIKILLVQSADSSNSLHVFTSIVSLAVTIGIIALLKRTTPSKDALILIFTILTVLYMIALVVVLLLGDSPNMFANRLWAASGRCFKAFIFMVFCVLANCKSLSPASSFCLFLVAFVALPDLISFDLGYQSPFLGWIVGLNIASPLAIIATFATAVLSISFLAAETIKLSREAAKSANTQPSSSKCQAALERKGLSERELQVAEYIYRGYSAKRTAEALFLSESTVNSHTRNVYRKLDIHSKQDLIRLVDEFSE